MPTLLTNQDVSIQQLETKKDKIKQPELAMKENNMIIPPLGSSVLISGKSGSGKSTLLANLLLDKRFYNGYFDKTFLFSPTANGDDIQKQLKIKPQHVFTDLDEAPDLLEVIICAQKEALEKTTADKAKQYAIIFDDVIGDTKFMNSKAFTQCFYQVRHICCTTFICTQHFTRVPRVCRLQANFIFYFRGSMSETEILVEEFAPPHMNKNEFRRMVVDATSEGFDFLTINMKMDWEKRFRKNLGELLPMPPMSAAALEKNCAATTNASPSFEEEELKQEEQKEEQHNGQACGEPSTRRGEQLQQELQKTGARGRTASQRGDTHRRDRVSKRFRVSN